MAEDSPQTIDSPSDSGRVRRPPPTIDLEATEVSAEPQDTGGAEPKPSSRWLSMAAVSTAAVAAVTGAGAAGLVIAVAWLLGWPGQTAPPAPAVSAAAVDDLAARVANVESKTSKPAAPSADPAAAARLEAQEKSLAALRAELAGLRAQTEKLASAVNDSKSAPRESAAADLSAIDERIAGLERAARAQSAEIAQGSARPADDVPLRRIVAAALLDVTARTGEPFAPALAAAKSLAPNPDALKPLDGFAATGVPNPFNLNRELLALVPKLSPPAPGNAGSGLVERLQAGAAKLVRIERTDAVGSDRGAIVARVTAAALRNDFNEARRVLKTLEPADRAAAQAWIDKADARDAALAASRQFAAEALTTLAKPAQ
jgi:hypothetical protein